MEPVYVWVIFVICVIVYLVGFWIAQGKHDCEIETAFLWPFLLLAFAVIAAGEWIGKIVQRIKTKKSLSRS